MDGYIILGAYKYAQLTDDWQIIILPVRVLNVEFYSGAYSDFIVYIELHCDLITNIPPEEGEEGTRMLEWKQMYDRYVVIP